VSQLHVGDQLKYRVPGLEMMRWMDAPSSPSPSAGSDDTTSRKEIAFLVTPPKLSLLRCLQPECVLRRPPRACVVTYRVVLTRQCVRTLQVHWAAVDPSVGHALWRSRCVPVTQ
jgi:hypothetical protein